MRGAHIAVVDVGKTNKKVLIFDSALRLVESSYKGFEESVRGEVHLEDLENMTSWILGRLTEYAKTFDIGAVSVTTHGATIVGIDSAGRVCVPPVAYTTEPGAEFDSEFYRVCGDSRDLQATTSTAALGLLINAGKTVLYMQQHYPEQFSRVTTILNLPQYFGYVLTGRTGAEPTYLGCHTYLLDFKTRQYSHVADRLGVRGKLPPIASNSWTVLGTVQEEMSQKTGLSRECIVTMGIHDSNSSLLPYLVKGHKDFVLNSTGTWCVAMHPTDTVALRPDEIGKLVFYNLDAFGNPVKTSIFMGGQELDAWRSVICRLSGRTDYPGFDAAACAAILREKKLFLLPSVVKGTGLFPDSVPRVIENGVVFTLDEISAGTRTPECFKDHDTACAALNISVTMQSQIALSMAGYGGGGSVFTEGGFRKNATYNAVLAALYPRSRVATTRLDEATAFGAALLARAALDGTTPMATRELFDIEIIDTPRPVLDGLEEYSDAFRRLIAAS